MHPQQPIRRPKKLTFPLYDPGLANSPSKNGGKVVIQFSHEENRRRPVIKEACCWDEANA